MNLKALFFVFVFKVYKISTVSSKEVLTQAFFETEYLAHYKEIEQYSDDSSSTFKQIYSQALVFVSTFLQKSIRIGILHGV